jgi:hypothetical protein
MCLTGFVLNRSNKVRFEIKVLLFVRAIDKKLCSPFLNVNTAPWLLIPQLRLWYSYIINLTENKILEHGIKNCEIAWKTPKALSHVINIFEKLRQSWTLTWEYWSHSAGMVSELLGRGSHGLSWVVFHFFCPDYRTYKIFSNWTLILKFHSIDTFSTENRTSKPKPSTQHHFLSKNLMKSDWKSESARSVRGGLSFLSIFKFIVIYLFCLARCLFG